MMLPSVGSTSPPPTSVSAVYDLSRHGWDIDAARDVVEFKRVFGTPYSLYGDALAGFGPSLSVQYGWALLAKGPFAQGAYWSAGLAMLGGAGQKWHMGIQIGVSWAIGS